LLVPSSSSRNELERAARKYADQLQWDGLVGEYLHLRGLNPANAASWMFGLVGEPEMPDHLGMKGWLSIPYVTRAGVTSVRFRRMPVDKDREGHFVFEDGPKYMSVTGDSKRLYNPEALFTEGDELAVCEGEFDTWAMNELVGVPAIGIPGVSGWTRAAMRAVDGFGTVYIVFDADQAGRDAARAVAETLPGRAVVVELPEKFDVNSLAVAQGAEAVLGRMGK
jgi:5S rRNA maturation endonuclease (ribonuclease M5)